MQHLEQYQGLNDSQKARIFLSIKQSLSKSALECVRPLNVDDDVTAMTPAASDHCLSVQYVHLTTLSSWAAISIGASATVRIRLILT